MNTIQEIRTFMHCTNKRCKAYHIVLNLEGRLAQIKAASGQHPCCPVCGNLLMFVKTVVLSGSDGQ